MMSSQSTDLRDVALGLADTADAVARRFFGEPVPAIRKPDGTPVTEADREIEARLREHIDRTLPEATVLGEEQGGQLERDGICFVIDPIDGTKNFMRAIPVFATLIGVLVDGQVVAGVVSAPAMGERWVAALGHGTRRNGAPMGVSAIDEPSGAHVLHGGLQWFSHDAQRWQRLADIANEAWRTRGFGEFWMHLLVAGGMAEVAFEDDLSIWDVAALEVIVTEAGGRMTGWDGSSVLTSGTALTTNGWLHDAYMARLTETEWPEGSPPPG